MAFPSFSLFHIHLVRTGESRRASLTWEGGERPWQTQTSPSQLRYYTSQPILLISAHNPNAMKRFPVAGDGKMSGQVEECHMTITSLTSEKLPSSWDSEHHGKGQQNRNLSLRSVGLRYDLELKSSKKNLFSKYLSISNSTSLCGTLLYTRQIKSSKNSIKYA